MHAFTLVGAALVDFGFGRAVSQAIHFSASALF